MTFRKSNLPYFPKRLNRLVPYSESLETTLATAVVCVACTSIVLGLANYTFASKLVMCVFWVVVVVVPFVVVGGAGDTTKYLPHYVVATVFYDLYGAYVWETSGESPMSRMFFLGLICLNCGLMVTLYGLLLRIRTPKNALVFCLRDGSLNHASALFVLIILFIAANFDIASTSYTPDSYSYYLSAKESLGQWNFTFSDLGPLQMAGHLAYGYSVFIDIGLLLWGCSGYKTIHIVMAAITICCFYGVLKKFDKRVSPAIQLLGTALFAFSPLFNGIIHGINSDFALACFFVWFTWASVNDNRPVQRFSAFLACFSKESGLVAFACYLFAELAIFLWRRDGGLREGCLSYFYSGKWLCWISVVLFAVLLLFGDSGWGENAKEAASSNLGNNAENHILINFGFIAYKLKEMFILNFAWLYLVLAIILAAVMVMRRVRFGARLVIANTNPCFLPLLASAAGFFAFNLLFFTYPHYRYLQLWNFYTSLFAYLGICKVIKSKCACAGVLCALVGVMGVQSFYSVDPLSKAVFPTISVGDHTIVSTKRYISVEDRLLTVKQDSGVLSQVFFDSTLLNKDQLGFEGVTELAFQQMNYDGSQKVIFPSLYGDSLSYTLLAMFGRADSFSFYWDDSTGNITDYPSGVQIRFYDIADVCGDAAEHAGERFYYLQYPYSYEYDEDSYLSNFRILETTEVDYKGWKINLLLLERL